MGPMDREGYKILSYEEMYAAIRNMSDEERARLLQVLLKYEAVEIQCKREKR
jgi:hypothetical protein